MVKIKFLASYRHGRGGGGRGRRWSNNILYCNTDVSSAASCDTASINVAVPNREAKGRQKSHILHSPVFNEHYECVVFPCIFKHDRLLWDAQRTLIAKEHDDVP